jgi:hypothetical protein
VGGAALRELHQARPKMRQAVVKAAEIVVSWAVRQLWGMLAGWALWQLRQCACPWKHCHAVSMLCAHAFVAVDAKADCRCAAACYFCCSCAR